MYNFYEEKWHVSHFVHFVTNREVNNDLRKIQFRGISKCVNKVYEIRLVVDTIRGHCVCVIDFPSSIRDKKETRRNPLVTKNKRMNIYLRDQINACSCEFLRNRDDIYINATTFIRIERSAHSRSVSSTLA